MKIEMRTVTVEELIHGYSDTSAQDGGAVVGFAGRLAIRPAFQRNFVYDDTQRVAVIDTLRKGFPLNVMYWSDCGDGRFEVIDGQQRIISIAQYAAAGEQVFEHGGCYFHNLTPDEQRVVLDYGLTVYVCSGTDREKLDWFQVINIAGEELTGQELLNAIYHGPWLEYAKRYFSRAGEACAAHRLGKKYIKAVADRQEYLRVAIGWACGSTRNDDIASYMAARQHEMSAAALWDHYVAVLDWVRDTFPNYRKEMRSVNKDWGRLYDEHHKRPDLHPTQLAAEADVLFADEEVQRKPGIYEYLLTRDEKHLNLRTFSDADKRTAYERQGGRCAVSGEHLDIGDMHADHITPWSKGGRTTLDNCQMINADLNRRKGAR